MLRPFFGASTLLVCVIIALAVPCFGQRKPLEVLPRFGAGAKISTLGIGIEAATGLTRKSNVRGGVNFFNYDRTFNQDGIDYGAQLRLRSVEAHFDWFMGGFHLSPGLLVYNNNRAEGIATVPGGRSFTLGSRNYISNPANPVAGTAEIDFSKNKLAPMATFGWGNLLRRSGRRVSVSFEAGVVFESSPKATLNLAGSACIAPAICANAASNSQIQSDMRAEENKINDGTAPYKTIGTVLKYYPVISLGIGYRFK